jgi:putative acetyltransferase
MGSPIISALPRGERRGIVIAMKIRHATAEDRDPILEVHAAAIRSCAATSGYSAAQIEAWSAFPAPEGHAAELRSGHVFVAEEDGRILGYGRFDSDTGEVEATYVLPVAQGRGVGSALLRESEDRARHAGFDSMYVSASLNAVEFYRRAGFEPQVKRSYELGNGQRLECMFMIKRLDATARGPGQRDIAASG